MQTSFSRFFPATHPQKGNPTLFVEKVSKSFGYPALGEIFYEPMDYHKLNPTKPHALISDFEKSIVPYWNRDCKMVVKKHTIRAGKKCKAGDVFTPFVWSGKPYMSPQIIFHNPIEIKRVVDFEIDISGIISLNGYYPKLSVIEILAKNDGLNYADFCSWLIPDSHKNRKPFSGQIRIWDDTDLLY